MGWLRTAFAVSVQLTTLCALIDAIPSWRLDSTFPQPNSPYLLQQIASAAIVRANSLVEIHVGQRGSAAPPIVVFNEEGTAVRAYGLGSIETVHGMQSLEREGEKCTLFISDIGQGTVKQFDPASGALLRSVGTPNVHGSGLSPLQFSAPADVAFIASGENITVAVSDGDGGSNNRVVVVSYDDLEDVAFSFGGNGTAPGRFNSPHSISYDEIEGVLLVADRNNSRIQAFAGNNGTWLGEWTNSSTASPCFGVPWGIRLDPAEKLWFIADGDNGRLYFGRYQLSPAFSCQLLQNVTVGIPNKPHEVAYDSVTGSVYLAGIGSVPTLQRYVRVS